jgi:hypothetical protein
MARYVTQIKIMFEIIQQDWPSVAIIIRRNFSYYLLLLGPMTRSYLTQQKMEKRFLG